MNFDRKSGNSNGKVAEGSNSFPELPRMFDDRAQNGFASHNAPAGHHNFTGNEYPSGAFPALDVAYSDQTIRNAGGNFAAGGTAPAHNETGFRDYENAEDSAYYEPSYGQAGSYAPVYAGGGDDVYRHERDYYDPAYGQAESGSQTGGYGADGQDFADDSYYGRGAFLPESEQGIYDGHESYGQGGGQYAMSGPHHNGAPDARNLTRGEQGMTAKRFAEEENLWNQNAANADNTGRAEDMPFTEEAFHNGLGGDSALQPARFDPSDYDYNYDPQAEEQARNNFSSPQQQEKGRNYPAGKAYGQRDFSPQNNAPPPPPNYGFSGSGNAGEKHAAIQSVPIGQSFSHGYSLNAAPSYNKAESPAYRDGRAFAPPAAEYYEEQEHLQNAMPAEDFAGAGFAYMGPEEERPYPMDNEAQLPFMEDEQGEEGDLAADFARLNADFAEIDRIDRMVGNFPLAGPEEMAGNMPPQAGHGREWEEFAAPPANMQKGRPADRAGAFYADPGGQSPAMRPNNAQNAAYAANGQNFAADAIYDDAMYDWVAPAAGGIAPPRQKGPPVAEAKGKKLLVLAAVLLVLVLIGAGLYWIFGGGHQAAYNGDPVIIHKAAGDYKVKPDNPVRNAADNQEQSVSEGVGGDNAAQSGQKTLIDKTETPLEMQKTDERLPFSNESRFDQSSVESLIKSVVAQATPVHIVPTVRVDADRKIIAPAGDTAEKVLIPGKTIIVSEPDAMQNSVKKADEQSAIAPFSHSAFAAVLPPPAKMAEAPVSQMRKPVTTKIPAAQTAAAAGDYYMQISSQPTKEAAEQSLRAARKYLSEAAGSKLMIVPAAIPDKGTYYRVRIPAQSREEAARLCEDYKQAGGHCFIAR